MIALDRFHKRSSCMHPRLRFATVFAFLVMAGLPASLAQAVPEIVTIAGQGNPGFTRGRRPCDRRDSFHSLRSRCGCRGQYLHFG